MNSGTQIDPEELLIIAISLKQIMVIDSRGLYFCFEI